MLHGSRAEFSFPSNELPFPFLDDRKSKHWTEEGSFSTSFLLGQTSKSAQCSRFCCGRIMKWHYTQKRRRRRRLQCPEREESFDSVSSLPLSSLSLSVIIFFFHMIGGFDVCLTSRNIITQSIDGIIRGFGFGSGASGAGKLPFDRR